MYYIYDFLCNKNNHVKSENVILLYYLIIIKKLMKLFVYLCRLIIYFLFIEIKNFYFTKYLLK